MISRSKGYLGRLFGSLRPTILEYLGCGFTTRDTGDDLNHIGVHWLHTFLGFIFRGLDTAGTWDGQRGSLEVQRYRRYNQS